MTILYILIILVVGMLAYVRFAPSDPAKWHTPVTATEDKKFKGGAIRVVKGDADALAKIDAAARALPRTEVLAGSVAEGRITYVTRTASIRFPDYTTVELDGDTIKMFARLRFGRSDFGVNAARLKILVDALQ